MPWKECRIVEERLRFIARLLDGETMAGLCREFGIARKTGYKIYTRYKDCGLDGLPDRSRRPYRHANQGIGTPAGSGTFGMCRCGGPRWRCAMRRGACGVRGAMACMSRRCPGSVGDSS